MSAVLLKPQPGEDSSQLVLAWQSSGRHRSTGEWFDRLKWKKCGED